MVMTKEYQKQWKKKRRDAVCQMKVARGCEDCGTQHPAVLDFHHNEALNGNVKRRISTMLSENAAWDKILAEMLNCSVLCANCHRIRHYTAG